MTTAAECVRRLAAAVELEPGLDDAGIAAVQARYPVPLPRELVTLLAATTGSGDLLDLDLTGERHSVEAAELLPAGHPVAADGFGNFWLLDLTPDTGEAAPVFYLSHDPPVLLYQSPDLATFLDEALRSHTTEERSLVDDVHDDRLYDVWGTRAGAMSWATAVDSPDVALHEFAASLDEAWTVVDLRRRLVGMGLVWGRYGPRTRLARAGWERIFGYAPHETPRRSWRRLGRRAR
jgi:hypothetical protein